MSDIFFDELDIPIPKYNLGIRGLHGAMIGRQLEAIEQILLEESPDKVLIYGDTNSTLACALAGAKLNIPVAHVEAGLRGFIRKMREESNRVFTDHIAETQFPPTEISKNNLLSESLARESIVLTGDVMYGA